MNKELYVLGITECETVFGNRVNAYNRERTICDLLHARKEIDIEVFSKAIKSYFGSPDRDFRKLREYAGKMNISDKLDDILEVI